MSSVTEGTSVMPCTTGVRFEAESAEVGVWGSQFAFARPRSVHVLVFVLVQQRDTQETTNTQALPRELPDRRCAP
jgi:hypothetical protein